MERKDDDLVQCPYDPSHRILRERFQVHLGRCRRNHPKSAMATCPFNATHILNKKELNWHVTICPERSTFEHFKHMDRDGLTSENRTAREEVPTIDGDAWDDEDNHPSYNPQTYCVNAPVLRTIQGATPSERKHFRKTERIRLLELKK